MKTYGQCVASRCDINVIAVLSRATVPVLAVNNAIEYPYRFMAQCHCRPCASIKIS
jgi:hypothetical protein